MFRILLSWKSEETEVCLDFYLARKVRKAFLNGMKMMSRTPLKREAGEEMETEVDKEKREAICCLRDSLSPPT